jgi:hypothetical protein
MRFDEKEIGIGRINFNNLFLTTRQIQKKFESIWKQIARNFSQISLNSNDYIKLIDKFVIYDALDGTRSTISTDVEIPSKAEASLYLLEFIHTLKAIGASNCIIMVHTSYNRERGEEEFFKILNKIKIGLKILEKYSLMNDIRMNCLCNNKNYELKRDIKMLEKKTINGKFITNLLFDYNESWIKTKSGYNMIESLPNIDVNIRHTKFNFSGGWIPEKMKKSDFLYSQNGTVFSNWKSDELIAQLIIALICKIINAGEALSKKYNSLEEIQLRHKMREKELFNKTIYLREKYKKLFYFGSPIGIYKIYY